MIRTIIWFIYFWISLCFCIPPMIKAKRYDRQGKTVERDEIVNKTVRNWARSLFKLSGSRVTVIGEENIPKGESVLFVSNHQGNFDIPLLLGYIEKPKAFIAKIELKKMPLIRTWMELMRCIFIDRKDIRQSVKAINQGVEFLKSGYSFVIFPEGTRSEDGSLGEFKAGSLKLATKSEVPIVPITIKGTNKIMRKKEIIIRPADVEIIISPPIRLDSNELKETKDLTDKVRNIIEKNL